MNLYAKIYDKLLMEGLPETVADKAAKLITERDGYTHDWLDELLHDFINLYHSEGNEALATLQAKLI